MTVKTEPQDLKFPKAALNELVLALKENRLIIVVGSGLSIACNLPSWEQLILKKMVDNLRHWGKDKKASQISNLDDELLYAADMWWENVSAEQRKDFFEKTFNPAELKPHENHQLLAQLPVRGLLTTNFDDLLEMADSRLYAIRKTGFDHDLGLLFRNKEKVFLKLHGTWNQSGSIILTKSQYARLELNQAYRKLYEAIQLHYRLLFLGYGGRDPDLEQMHRQLSQIFNGELPDRYLLLNKPAEDLKAVLNQTKACRIAEYDGEKEGHGVITDLLRYLFEQSTGQTKVTKVIETETDVLKVYRQFLHKNYDSIQIFQDKYFKLADIYVSLRLEYNPLLYEKLDELEFQRKCLPEEQMPVRIQEARGKKIGKFPEPGTDWATLTIDDVLCQTGLAIILGEAGSGKTTLFKHLIARYNSEKTDYVPVFLSLQQWLKHDQADSLAVFCQMLFDGEVKFEKKLIPELKVLLNDFREKGKILLLLDGLDEMGDADFKKTCDWLNQFEKSANKVLVSCRRASFSDKTLLNKDLWSRYAINPFNEKDQQQFIRNYFKNQPDIAERLIILVEGRSRLRSLGQSPLLLGLICYIYETEKQNLPEDRVILYQKCVKELLNRRKEQEFAGIPEFKLHFLNRLAFHFFYEAQPPRREIFGEKEVLPLLRQEIEKSQSELTLKSALKPDRARDLLKELVEKNSLLLPVGGEQYSFPHRSFQEYFAACYLKENQAGAKLIKTKFCQDPFWTEVICLYAGMQADPTQLINELGKLKQVDLVLRIIPDTAHLNWKQLDSETLNWKIRRGAVERLVLPEPEPNRLTEITQILEGVLKADVNANVRYSALIALEKVGTPEAKRIVAATHIIPEAVLLEHKPYSDTIRGIKFQINQAGMPPNMVLVPGGSYTMGETEEKVTVKPFYMSLFPVTNWEFKRFIEVGGYKAEKYWTKEGWQERNKEKWEIPRWWDDARFNQEWQPVVGISWYEAAAYCHWLTETQNAKKPFRLPKEEEWEWAARGPKGNECAFGDWNEDIPRWDSYRDYEKGLTYGTSRVNSVYKENISDFGLFDLTGNVWEWTESWYDENTKSFRVIRGGSWIHSSHVDLRAAFRSDYIPRGRYDGVGFRYCQDSP